MKDRTSGFSRSSRRGAAQAGGRAPRTTKTSAPPPAAKPPFWKSPIVLLTGGVLVVAVVAIGLLQLAPGSGHSGPAAPGSTSAAGIFVPADGTPENIAFGRSLGRPDAPIHLVVWSDFQCPACKAFADTNEPQLIRDYVIPGKLRIDYRDLVIIGPESSAAAAAARCADQQSQFWPYHDVLFANQLPENSGGLGPKRLKDMADAIGLDRVKFDACLPSNDLFNQIQAESQQGQGRGNATPILDFGTVVIEGSPPYDSLKQTVDGLLAVAPSASATGASPSGASPSGASPSGASPSGAASASASP